MSASIRILPILAMLTLTLLGCGGGNDGGVATTISSSSSSSFNSSTSSSSSSASSVPAPSSLSYSNPVTLLVGQSISTLSPTVSGSVTAWSVSPSLPTGIALNSSSGQISGTPTVVTAQSGYVITASNTSGSATFTLLLAVTQVPPPTGLSYSSPITLTVGQTLTVLLNPVVSGAVTAYSVTPVLPAGLSINSTTGAISGTPTVATATATYTITASNPGGSATFGLSLTVNPSAAPALLSYPSPVTLVVSQAMTPIIPTVAGTVLGYSVSPALPSGLSLNTTSGQISGTPTVVAAQANYTVTASNAAGSTAFILVLKVDAIPLAPPSGLSYPNPRVYTVGAAITPIIPTVTGTVTAYSVSPALPAGLSLNTSSGQISGTPTVASAAANYTLTAGNSSGSTTFVLNLTVNIAPPSALSYPSPHTFVVGTPISVLSPAVTGTVASYSVAPALPAGLALNTSNGQIAGTPTTATVQAGYTVTASNSSGSTSFVVTITVNALQPSGLSYPNPQTYSVGTPIAVLSPTVTGTVTSYSVTPALPAGLVINTSNGQISGTPTAVSTLASYTVTASNSGGLTTFTLSITVNAATSAPAAPTVIVGYSLKQVVLSWGAAAGATYYKIYKNPDGASGYTQIGSNQTAISYSDGVAVHLTDWINARYLISACNAIGCTDSSAIFAMNSVQAIGYIKASDTEQQDTFGWKVDISADGNTLAVAASGKDSDATGVNGNQGGNLNSAGAVYIFIKNGSNWTQQAFLKASNPGSQDIFGSSVALSDDGSTLAVGAYREASNATGINGDQLNNSAPTSGAVYVFTRSGTAWTQQAYIKASNTEQNDRFGEALALSGDGNTLAVGAYGESSNATGINGNQTNNSMSSAGAVYVYVRAGGSWSQQAYVKASNSGASNLFGWSLALSESGNTLVVGADHENSDATGINGDQTNDGAIGSGAVYVFTRSGTAWTQQTYIKGPTAAYLDRFGTSVALSSDGNMLAVGSQVAFGNTDRVVLYSRSGGTWSQQAYLLTPDPNSGTAYANYFGHAVAFSSDGNILAVSAQYDWSNATGINGNQINTSSREAGAAYIYVRNGASWTLKSYIKASNTQVSNTMTFGGDAFGISLSLTADGGTLAIGGYGEDSPSVGIGGSQTNKCKETPPSECQLDSGAVYLY